MKTKAWAASRAGFGEETEPTVSWWSSLKLREGLLPLRQLCFVGVTWRPKRGSMCLKNRAPFPASPSCLPPHSLPRVNSSAMSCLTAAAAIVPTQSPNVKVIRSWETRCWLPAAVSWILWLPGGRRGRAWLLRAAPHPVLVGRDPGVQDKLAGDLRHSCCLALL